MLEGDRKVPMIREAVVTTIDPSGSPHLAPLGLIEDGQGWVIAPFRPSTTLDNLMEAPFAVANYTDDARIFAGLVTGRRDWPLVPAAKVPVPRLSGALAHAELGVARIEDDAERPRSTARFCIANSMRLSRGSTGPQRRSRMRHPPHRLHILPRDKIEREIAYLAIAIEKTAGPREREAWSWLMQKRGAFYAEN